jgi:aldose 1-epimerase
MSPQRTAPSGVQHALVGDGYEAVVTEVGASLRRLSYDGRDLVVGWSADEMMPAHRGALLAPWPNRIADGRYQAPDGAGLQLPLSEPKRHNAIHGLVSWAAWRLVARTEASVVLAHRLHPQTGYPFLLELSATYALGPDGLTCSVQATNLGGAVAPYGCAPHPYLVAGPGRVDDWTLEVPATRVLEVTEDRMLPVQVVDVEGTRYDYRVPHRIGDAFLDHAYTGLRRDDAGAASVRALGADGSGVEVRFGPDCPWVQVHTADRPEKPEVSRIGLAVEPMTCPPDAFNSGVDLVRLEPGESHSASWTIGRV